MCSCSQQGVRRGRVVISFLPVQKQPDGYNCGIFSIAFAAEILEGAPLKNAKFDVQQMRQHLISCLEKKKLSPFPKIREHSNNESGTYQ